MSSQHTQGPWKIERGYGTIIKSIGPCVPDEYAGSAWLKVSEANARLIAAAPDLLEALKACDEAMSYMSEYDIPLTLPAQVKAAIAKATT